MIEITCSFNSFRDERRGERAWTYIFETLLWVTIDYLWKERSQGQTTCQKKISNIDPWENEF